MQENQIENGMDENEYICLRVIEKQDYIEKLKNDNRFLLSEINKKNKNQAYANAKIEALQKEIQTLKKEK